MGFFSSILGSFGLGNSRTSSGSLGDRFRGQPSRIDQRLNRVKQEREQLEAEDNSPEGQFLSGAYQSASSSNVAGFRYLAQEQTFEVEYKDGSIYHYLSVGRALALNFFRAPSRGKAVWDYFRIRHTKLGHQKDYVMVIGPTRGGGKDIAPGFGTRGWEASKAAAGAHTKKVETQSSMPAGYMHRSPQWESAKARARKKV